MKTRVTVIVKGLVQGVSFRYYTARAAARHSVNGWVMNLPDGSVQACFEGEEEDVRQMVQWCQHGPDLAQVDEVIERKEDYQGDYTGFNIRHSYD